MADDGRRPRDPVAPEMEPTEEIEHAGTRLLGDRRRMLSVLAAFVLLIAGIYILLPKITGVSGSLKKLSDPNWVWVGVAVAFKALSFVAYAALFKGVLGGSDEDSAVHRRLGLGTSLNITLAGLTATTLFSAAGAGGVALTYWALRKAGMERRSAASRMVAFLVLMYAVYAAALIVFGVLLRTHVLSGNAPLGGTIVPAGIAAALFVLVYLIALIPTDLERRMARHRFVRRIASVPATIGSGTRSALAYVRHPGSGSTALLGAVGYWATMVGILWASFHAFGGGVPLGVVVQGFFVGMAANLAPSPAAGAGTLDAGLIGAFLLFNIPSATVFPAVLTFRLVGFWLPILPGLVSYFALRRQVNRWQQDDRRSAYTSQSKVTAEAK